jgi:cell division protein FtsN
VSDQYEPSYYEIALTGRQVLVAFVVLLVCLVAAFFSGVWIGSGGGDSEERPPEVAREEASDGEPLQELSFFEEEPMDRPRDLGEVAREPRRDTTLLEDVDGPRADRAERARREREAEARTAEPPDETDPTPPPAPEPRPAPQPAPATPSSPATTGDLVIQVFVSGEEPAARDMLARVTGKGFRAFLSPVTDGGRTLYRVRVGPFERRSDAEATAARLKSELGLETWITQ